MITIKCFEFNPFRVNTYLLHDQTNECIIIDAGCYDDDEKDELIKYIDDNKLELVASINTHNHIDHIIGNSFIKERYDILPQAHHKGEIFLRTAKGSATVFRLDFEEAVWPEKYISEKDIFAFGKSSLRILYTPGHADGSICLVNDKQKFVITGDVLFLQSIGRTDLPTGCYDVLIDKIENVLIPIGDDYTVYPGHGPKTTLGFERENNPFLFQSNKDYQ